MPIQEQNIVFVESQVMDDVPEGGGAATGNVIPDGQMNNVFEDISDLDRAYGRFNLRKLFLAVRALNTDLYGGAKTVITALPTDPALGYTLFTTSSPFDTRADAAGRVEAYLYKGPMWHGALHENHITGMRAINILQRVDTELPPIGKTLCLVQDEGEAGQKEQYVRVIRVEAVTTTFEDANGEFQRWVVRLDLSDALRYDFLGHSASRTDGYNYADKTRLRNTTVADATRYYGSQPLADAASIGDLTVRARSLFAQLVPSAQTETPLVSQPLAPELIQTWDAGARTVQVPQQAHTRALAVTAENRRFNWIETLEPRPAVLTLSIAYRALGNWYVLTDNGAGILSGTDATFGSGTVNYLTGDCAVTLGALPDAGSQILYAWASPTHYAVRLTDGDSAVTLTITASDPPISAATWTASWLAGGVTQTASSNASGVISGNATGTLDAVTGVAVLRLTQLPDRNTDLTLNYSWYEPNDPGEPSAVYSATFGPEPRSIVAGADPASLRFRLSYLNAGFWPIGTVYAVGQADGTIVVPVQRMSAYAKTNEPQTIGNYAGGAGIITLNSTLTITGKVWTGSVWDTASIVNVPLSSAADAHQVIYSTGATTLEAHDAETIPITALQYALTQTNNDAIVANSVRLQIGGRTYDDYNGALLQTSDNTLSGSVNYETRVATLTYWADGITVSPAITSLLVRIGDWSAITASFRTAASPIKPEALSLVAVTTDGVQITGSADADGVIAGTWMRGEMNYEFGTAWVEFGQLDGEDWAPREVDPATIRYNAVAYSYIPLDADILGIDAVRLPADGRVPIYRSGHVVMILHADETTGTPAQVGGTGPYLLSCGRTRLAWVKITDANDAAVTEGYTLDRAAGVLSWDSLAGLATPLTVEHTIGDLRLVTDAQINGTLTLARPLSHEFPANESLVASCLIHGDRRARVSAVWDQASWNGTWTDALVGSAATATLNTIDFPITVTNEGCDTDRWLLRWLTTTTAELISEKRGLVWTGSYPAYVSGPPVDIAPINPRTRDSEGLNGVPYLTIPQKANGGGWSAGNVVRINTVGAIADFWIARAIAQSDEPDDENADGCTLYALGNIDRP